MVIEGREGRKRERKKGKEIEGREEGKGGVEKEWKGDTRQ